MIIKLLRIIYCLAIQCFDRPCSAELNGTNEATNNENSTALIGISFKDVPYEKIRENNETLKVIAGSYLNATIDSLAAGNLVTKTRCFPLDVYEDDPHVGEPCPIIDGIVSPTLDETGPESTQTDISKPEFGILNNMTSNDTLTSSNNIIYCPTSSLVSPTETCRYEYIPIYRYYTTTIDLNQAISIALAWLNDNAPSDNSSIRMSAYSARLIQDPHPLYSYDIRILDNEMTVYKVKVNLDTGEVKSTVIIPTDLL